MIGSSVAAPGSPVTLAVKTFDPGSSVRFTLLDRAPVELGEAVADGHGLARATLRLPRDVPNGRYTVRASGVGQKGVQAVDIQLTVRRQTARPPFAVTSAQYRRFLGLVAALLLFVLFAIQVRRRRRFTQAGYRA
jgi:hypothetical protein